MENCSFQTFHNALHVSEQGSSLFDIVVIDCAIDLLYSLLVLCHNFWVFGEFQVLILPDFFYSRLPSFFEKFALVAHQMQLSWLVLFVLGNLYLRIFLWSINRWLDPPYLLFFPIGLDFFQFLQHFLFNFFLAVFQLYSFFFHSF